ncbi:MAG TPA: hypothetical protein VEH76_14835 [Methylocystis sp.]|nr:hypothetical protein [Methylocystis sp.]
MRRYWLSMVFTLNASSAFAQSASPRVEYMGRLAQAIHQHVPAVSNLGPGRATCRFRVTDHGALVDVSCPGASEAQVSLLRDAIAATQPLGPPPGGGFATSQTLNFLGPYGIWGSVRKLFQGPSFTTGTNQ